MKIGIDISQTAYVGTGVARYTTMLVKSLLQYDKNNEYILFYSSLRQPLPDQIKTLAVTIKQFKIPPTILDIVWNRLHILPIEKCIGKVDIVFTSDWVEPPSHAKKITTIHDLIALKFPQSAHNKTELDIKNIQVTANIVQTQKRRLEWVKKESTLIVCDSLSTKRDAEELLKIESSRLKVIYPAIEAPLPISNEEAAQTVAKFAINKSYILTVGTLSPRKNIERLVTAFNKAQIPDVELCIVGTKGWDTQAIPKQDNIHFLGFVSDAQLQVLYKQALFFILPSLYEGFGYPLVEAMMMGCPTATSKTSSLEEIGKDASYLFDPYSVDDISEAITDLAKNQKLRKELAKKGLLKSQEYSYENFAKQMLEVIQNI